MTILSIQSYVCFGTVGNAAALFSLQRLGHEVWPVPTVAFSNHPGYGSWRGHAIASDTVGALIDGIRERGAFSRCKAVLSGYLGSTETGHAVMRAVSAVKAASPAALFCCDPVIGDRDDGLYVPDDIVGFFRDRALALADILVPNAFELEVLAGQPVASVDGAVAAARSILGRGPKLVVIKSFKPTAEKNSQRIATLAVTAAEAWQVATPKLALRAKGAGDMFTALFLGYFLRSGDAADALGRAASSAFAVIEATVAADARELALIQAQDRMAEPTRRFTAECLET